MVSGNDRALDVALALPEGTSVVAVVSHDGSNVRLAGCVRPADLLAAPEYTVADVMDRAPRTVRPSTRRHEALEISARGGHDVLLVTDSYGGLFGAVHVSTLQGLSPSSE